MLRDLAQRLADGDLAMDEGVDRAAARRTLLAVPGFSPALVDELGLRGLGDPDAFPAGDPGLLAAARRHGLPGDAASLAGHAQRWRPWRGYAAHLLGAAGTAGRPCHARCVDVDVARCRGGTARQRGLVSRRSGPGAPTAG